MQQNRYQSLREKLDAKAAELSLRHQDQLQCRKACHSCCQPGLSVFPIEAREIRSYLESEGKQAEALGLESSDPFNGQRCSFLAADGACSIYPVRPLVCRSHGLPLQYRNESEDAVRDVCPLNFQELSLESLPGDAVLNLDLINALLTLINQEAFAEKAAERISLRASALLAASWLMQTATGEAPVES